MDKFADEDSFGRQFVSTLCVLGNRVPDLMNRRHPDSPHSRPSLYEQASELIIAVTALIENWSNWPDWETHDLRTYQFEPPFERDEETQNIERVGGYREDDVTYWLIPDTEFLYPVRVDELVNGYLEIVPMAVTSHAYPEIVEKAANRRFFILKLSPGARFGGDNERLVNSERKSGPELRLLAIDYPSKTLD